MNPDNIITLINLGAQALKAGIDLYNQSQATLSEEDDAKIKAALADAQAQTDLIRPQVNAALDEAAKQ